MKRFFLLLVAFLFVFLFVYIGGSIAMRNARAGVAESQGEKFIAKLYAEYTIVGKSCQGEDTDSDSYVSCDFRITNASSTEKVVHLQCPTIRRSLFGNTCKETRLILNQ